MFWGKQQCDQCFSIQKIIQPTKSIPQPINKYSLRMSQKNPQKVSLKKSIQSTEKLPNFINQQFKVPSSIQQFVQNPKKHIKSISTTLATNKKNTQTNLPKQTNIQLKNFKQSYQFPAHSTASYYFIKPNLYKHQRISSQLNQNDVYFNTYQPNINNFERISLKEVGLNQLLPKENIKTFQIKKTQKDRLWMPTLNEFDEFDQQENQLFLVAKKQNQKNKLLNDELQMKKFISQENQKIKKKFQGTLGIKKKHPNSKIQFRY